MDTQTSPAPAPVNVTESNATTISNGLTLAHSAVGIIVSGVSAVNPYALAINTAFAIASKVAPEAYEAISGIVHLISSGSEPTADDVAKLNAVVARLQSPQQSYFQLPTDLAAKVAGELLKQGLAIPADIAQEANQVPTELQAAMDNHLAAVNTAAQQMQGMLDATKDIVLNGVKSAIDTAISDVPVAPVTGPVTTPGAESQPEVATPAPVTVQAVTEPGTVTPALSPAQAAQAKALGHVSPMAPV